MVTPPEADERWLTSVSLRRWFLQQPVCHDRSGRGGTGIGIVGNNLQDIFAKVLNHSFLERVRESNSSAFFISINF
jgi:hypothetical protein